MVVIISCGAALAEFLRTFRTYAKGESTEHTESRHRFRSRTHECRLRGKTGEDWIDVDILSASPCAGLFFLLDDASAEGGN